MEFLVPPFITDVDFSDGVIEGTLELGGEVFDAVFDTESESPTQAEYDVVFAQAERFQKAFEQVQKTITRETAEDITDEAYQDTIDEASETDYAVLEADLILKAAQFFPDETMLIFESPKVFPKEEIVVQLTSDFEVDEVYFD